jgi:hypothetical protein
MGIANNHTENILKAWTYSHLEKFATCPKQFYHTSVVKDFVSPPTEATIWGHRVHEAFENRINNGATLPKGMEHWERIAKRIDSLEGNKYAEIKLAIGKGFQPADWDSAWSRGIADLVVIREKNAMVLDYKTGKRKPSEQLDLYAAYIFAHYPEVEDVKTIFVWLKDQKTDKKRFNRDELPIIWREFIPKVARLESAYNRDSWPAKPSGLCNGWCPVKTCQHYKEKR